MSHERTRDSQRILFIGDVEVDVALPGQALMAPGFDWRVLPAAEAVAFLRAEPFTVTAVVVAANGEDAATRSLISELKSVAPRVAIVFLDESGSASAEVRVRQSGVHYYAHVPVSADEITAVLDGLSAFRAHDPLVAVRPAS